MKAIECDKMAARRIFYAQQMLWSSHNTTRAVIGCFEVPAYTPVHLTTNRNEVYKDFKLSHSTCSQMEQVEAGENRL